MSTALTTLDLLNKCKRFILDDPIKTSNDRVIEDAIITASREIASLNGVLPMAWNRETYDEIFTRYYASISAVTKANPGVITADSVDPDLTSDHGFQTDDIVYIAGIGGMERLNTRLFRAVRASATTLTLKTLDGQTGINTTDYETWSSGGTIYHAGIVLPASTIQPADSWVISRVWGVTFDRYPCSPVTDERATANRYIDAGGRPAAWRYQKYTYSTFIETNIDHVLFWYGFPGMRYNVEVKIEKSYPDISTFKTGSAATYPPHPPEIHDYIWHRALANLATQSEKAKRKAVYKDFTGDNVKIEIVNAQYWLLKAAQDEIAILAYHRSLLGDIPHSSSGMSA
uniref:Putative tail tubular protein n=2 Tax=viral metagenome TaxID=1070528 RepID=A0A6H1ZJN1_9ZZZZ